MPALALSPTPVTEPVTKPVTKSVTEPGTSGAGRARHPVVVGHLVMGVALLGLLGVWALVAGDVVEGADIRFLLPAPWVLAGVAGLIALITSDRRRHERRETGWMPAPGTVSAPVDPTSSKMDA